MLHRTALLVAAAMAACTPRLVGTCASSADCQAGETCSAEHLCLRPGAGNENGTVDLITPANGAIEKGVFHVSAQVGSAVAVQAVNFVLSDPQSAVTLGTASGTATGNVWSADLAVAQSSFGGLADLRAVLQRNGLPDVTSAKVTVTIDQIAPSIAPSWNAAKWWALDAGITLTANVSDDRTNVASAFLLLPDGGTRAATIAGGVATFEIPASDVGTPGAALAVPIALRASDGAGNQAANGGANVRVDGQPPSISLQSLDPNVWRNGGVDFTATLDDGAGAGLGSASVLVNGAFVAGQPDAGGVFQFHADLGSLPPTEAAVALQVVGTDAVGNLADAGFTLNVDNVPPAITPQPIAGGDYVDRGGTQWFAGPTVAPSAGPVVVTATIVDANLGTASAIVGGTSYPGTLSNGTWSFSIPRSVGKDASGPVTVSFDAQDLAGNHPAALPTADLQFDDMTAASFAPSIATDATWYARGTTVKPAVGVTMTAMPRSGVASVVLKTPSQPDVTCTSSGAASWTCVLPSTYAPAGTEGALAFMAIATSNVGGSSSANGSRNIDDAPPVISTAAAIPYPTGAGALAWGHDGAHFTLRDNATLYVFGAYDCGGGVDTASLASSFTPAPSSRTVTATASAARHACANGSNAVVYDITATANLSTTPAGSLSALDNVETLGVSVADAAGHVATAQKGVAVTRRLWSAAVGATVSFLALGTELFASGAGGLYSLDPASGALATWTVASPPETFIAYNGGQPAVVYADGSFEGSSVIAGDPVAGPSAPFGSCAYVDPSSSDGFTLSQLEMIDGSTVSIQGTRSFCTASNQTTCCSTEPGCNVANCGALANCSACCKSRSTAPVQTELVLSGHSVSCTAGGTAGASRCNGAPSPPGGLANAVSNTAGVYVGASGNNWAVGNTASTWGGPIAAGHGWPLIDGSGSVAYLPDVAGGGIDAVTFDATGFGSRLYNLSPPFPAVVSDMTLSAGGILYVLSNNAVFAVITDSTAPQSGQAAAWPSQCHDPCQSSLAGFVCPF